MSAVLGNIKCACGGAVPILPGKGGTLNGRCPGCGTQTLIRSPAAVDAWRKAFDQGKAPPGEAAPPPAAKAGGSGLVID